MKGSVNVKKIIILLLCLVLVSCGITNKSKSITKDTSENSSTRVKKKGKEKLIYKKDKGINSFLNKYNEINDPDITSDIVSMRTLRGHDRPDIVGISNDKLEIWIYGKDMIGDEMAVYVQGYSNNNVTNDDLKEEFIKYSKVFDDNLTDEEIDKYWNNMLSGEYSENKLKNIEVSKSIFYGKVEYFKIEGDIEFKSNN